MIWIAAFAIGTACYLAAGAVAGRMPDLRIRRTRVQRRHPMQLWLQQAGVHLSPRQFVGASAILGAAAFALVVVVTSTPLVAIVPAVGVGILPFAYYGRRRAARLSEVQESWPDGLRDLRASIAAGRSLPQALLALCDSGPEALRAAFERYPRLSRVLGTVAALEVIKEELSDPTSDRVIEVLILAHERGGAIVADILDDLVVATTRDLKVRDEISTDTLEMKINSRAVLVMPWLVLVALTLRAGPFRDFYRTRAGLVVIVVAAVMTGVGTVMVTRLARARTEQRVLGSAASVR